MSLLHAALTREQDWRTPDPDETDGPPLCNVCGVETTPYTPIVMPDGTVRKGKRTPGRPILCLECRGKGYKTCWCECGAVLHRRDLGKGHRACGKCRREINERHDRTREWGLP